MDYKVGEQVFNDWQIVREIGSGASGTVWEIVKIDHDISTSSALKVIRVPQKPSMAKSLYGDGMDEVSVTQFFQGVVNDLSDEIKIMIDMKGFPYIVNCEDYSVVRYPDEIKWDILIRMELLTPVQEYIQRNVLTEADVLKMGRELLQTLELFENKGIIHRDISRTIFLWTDTAILRSAISESREYVTRPPRTFPKRERRIIWRRKFSMGRNMTIRWIFILWDWFYTSF